MALVQALDQRTTMQVGENGNVEHGWSADVQEKFCQFFFQLVRTKNMVALEHQLDTLIRELKGKRETYALLGALYKMVGQTRDIVAGKGEYSLAFMQLWVWYQHYPELALYAFTRFFYATESDSQTEHPYGSWKDIKYFADYVKRKSGTENHPFIKKAISFMVNQLRVDYEKFMNGEPISLAAKWCPREKSKYTWLYHAIVREFRTDYFTSALTHSQLSAARKKASREFRRMLSSMNKYLQTTQIAQCKNEWSTIDFNNVTSITMNKNKLAFQNKTKMGNVRSCYEDRVQCAENLKQHIVESIKPNGTAKVHGKRVNVYELVKSAIMSRSQEDRDITNLQWADNATQNAGLANFIAMADTSGSMTVDNNIPLYNSIGLAIRVSELTNDAYKNRVMTFSAVPEWVDLSQCETFVDKVGVVSHCNWGMNTNFYGALKLILDVAVKNQLPPSEVNNMVLAVFSDMQIDAASNENFDTMYENIEKMYANAGLQTQWKTAYKPPHILFWNLRSTTGFPTLSSQKNVTMLSGYSAVLLNAFQKKGIEGLREFTPYKMICDVLNHERYNVLENKFYNSVEF
jgi:hypothetical protein